MARPINTNTNVSPGTSEGSNSGSWARKINMARAFTNPVITDLDTKRIKYPIFIIPAEICKRPASMVAASKY